ncbi:MAG: NAD(P)H-dependent glycerol-3-phosphate dehydrogenase [Thermodesulfobacteriota bacterium]
MKPDHQTLAVIGAGSWGTALAKLLADKGAAVRLWARRPALAQAIDRDRENRDYLPGAPLPGNLFVTSDLTQAVAGACGVVMVVPSHGFRPQLAALAPFLDPSALLVSAVKGVENDTLCTMSQVMSQVLPGPLAGRIAVLAGPSFAREVAAGQPTAVTVAGASLDIARAWQRLFHTDRFRVYTSTDLIGLELGGAVKNVVAIAAGIADGLGFGTNTRAALITRGLAEIIRLGLAMGANPLTFSGLGGLGDLVLTCTGDLSRNRQVGLALGQGKGLAQILAGMQMVAEGVRTTRSIYQLAARHRVEMPITEQVYRVLYEGQRPMTAVQELLAREGKDELAVAAVG